MGVGKNVDMEIHNSSLFPLYCCYVIIDADTESLVVLRHRKLIPLTQDFLLSAVLSFLSVHGCCIKTYLSDTLIESVASLIEYVWEASDVQFTPRCKLSLCLIIFEAVWVILSRSLGVNYTERCFWYSVRLMYVKWAGRNISHTFLNITQSSTAPPFTVTTSTASIMTPLLSDTMWTTADYHKLAEVLHWIILDSTGLPNKLLQHTIKSSFLKSCSLNLHI